MNLVCYRSSAAGGKEGLQQGGGFLGEEPGSHVHLMIQFGAGKKLEAGAEGATFGIVSGIDKVRDTSLDDGAGTHGAGLQGDIQSGVRKPIIAENSRSFAQHDDFCVGSGIIIANGAIARVGEICLIVNEHSADGYFASISGRACLFQSEAHEVEIVRHGNARIARPGGRVNL
jgi:hypothetical protein